LREARRSGGRMRDFLGRLRNLIVGKHDSRGGTCAKICIGKVFTNFRYGRDYTHVFKGLLERFTALIHILRPNGG